MYQFDGLIQRFGAAGLRLRRAPRPFAGGENARDVFGLDIAMRKGRETFRIWPGHEDNEIQVLGADGKLNQLVLTVKEADRFMETNVPRWTVAHQKERHGDNWLDAMLDEHQLTRRDLVRVDEARNLVTIRRKVSGDRNHMLCGTDERHYFVAGLPEPVSTVSRAHDILRAPEVRERMKRERGRVGRTRRQGEWFFLTLNERERSILEAGLAANRLFVRHKITLERATTGRERGNPHLCSEVVVMPGGIVYVRGSVRHPEHKTLKFRDWRRVVRNTEKMDQNAALGINWID